MQILVCRYAAVACIASGLLIVLAASDAQAQSGAMKDVTFSLDIVPLGRHAPWYTALEKGYFKAEGLNVKIVPGKGSAQVVQALESGIADMAFTGVLAATLGYTRGTHLRIASVMYQKSPYAVFSLKNGANVRRAQQLEGLTIASGAGSSTPKLIRGFMAQKGLDPSKLKITNIAQSARASMLLAGKVPAIETFVMAQPGLERAARAAKTEVVTYLLGDDGLKLYSNGVVAKDSYVKANPDVVRKFVRASLRGWQFALRHPKEAAELERRHIGGLKVPAILTEMEIVRRLAVTDDTRAHGLGWFDPARIKEDVDFLVKNLGLKGNIPDPKRLYAAGMLPKVPILP